MSRLLASRLSGPDRMQSVLFSRGAAHRASAYEPFGYRAGAPGGIAFNGQLPEGATGHYLLGHGHRGYSPALRRFLSPDARSPFAAGGLNAYAYCQGDPVNATDPTGQARQVFFGVEASAAFLGLGAGLLALSPVATSSDETGANEARVSMQAVGTLFVLAGIGSAAVLAFRKHRARLARLARIATLKDTTNPAWARHLSAAWQGRQYVGITARIKAYRLNAIAKANGEPVPINFARSAQVSFNKNVAVRYIPPNKVARRSTEQGTSRVTPNFYNFSTAASDRRAPLHQSEPRVFLINNVITIRKMI